MPDPSARDFWMVKQFLHANLRNMLLAQKLARHAARGFGLGSRVRARRALSMNAEELREAVHPKIKGRRRFYENVSVHGTEQGFEIRLDGRALRTPGRRPFHLPSETLAFAIATEWDAQQGEAGIEPASMPLMSLAATALDQIAVDPQLVQKTCMTYLHTDTACYFSSAAENRELRTRQRASFLPVLEWVERGFDLDGVPTLQLATSETIMRKLQHPATSVVAIDAVVSSLSPWALASLQCATMECKSIVIALALLLKHLDVPAAEACARLEEDIQIEQWGLVEGGHDHDLARIRTQLSSAVLFCELCEPGLRRDVAATLRAC